MEVKPHVSKKRPMKQYLSYETLTEILESRFKLNLTDRECSGKHNVSVTLAKKILKKYGEDYILANNLCCDLPDNKALIAFWRSTE